MEYHSKILNNNKNNMKGIWDILKIVLDNNITLHTLLTQNENRLSCAAI